MNQKKWHINSKGIPEKCSATKRKCPYSETSPHFDSEIEAQKYADTKLSDIKNDISDFEAKEISEIELNLFYNPTEDLGTEKITLEQLGKSKSYLSRIEAIRNGYKEEKWENENDPRVIDEIINNTKYKIKLLRQSNNPLLIDKILKHELNNKESEDDKNSLLKAVYQEEEKNHKIVAIQNGYCGELILKEKDDDVKKVAIEKDLFLREFARDMNPSVASSALTKINKKAEELYKFENSQRLWKDFQSGVIQRDLDSMDKFSFYVSDNMNELVEVESALIDEFGLNLDLDQIGEEILPRYIVAYRTPESFEKGINQLEKNGIKFNKFSSLGDESYGSKKRIKWYFTSEVTLV